MGRVLKLENVHRTFVQGERTVKVLRGISLSLEASELVGLLGPSGSGKSTLLHIAALLDNPDQGDIWIEERCVTNANEEKKTKLRRNSIGFVYQFHHLLKEFTAVENVMLPLQIAGWSKHDAHARAESLLETLGLTPRQHHLPAELSGGEQQRVAIARALANQPRLILADEPTGNLDETTALQVMDMLVRAVQKGKAAALIATHNITLAERLNRCLHLHDGLIESK